MKGLDASYLQRLRIVGSPPHPTVSKPQLQNLHAEDIPGVGKMSSHVPVQSPADNERFGQGTAGAGCLRCDYMLTDQGLPLQISLVSFGQCAAT